MAAFDPYAEGHWQSAAQVAQAAHDLFMMPTGARPDTAVSDAANTQSDKASNMSGSVSTQPGTMVGMPAGMTGMTGMAGMTGVAGSAPSVMMPGAAGSVMQGGCRLSTRNLLRGRVASVTPGAVNAVVVVNIGCGQFITASILIDSVRDLNLRAGAQVTVAINANDVLLVG